VPQFFTRRVSAKEADQHDRIWEVQEPLNFPLTVYGLEREEASMIRITGRLSEALATHTSDASSDRSFES
jgi:hypothetical protein